MDLREIIIGKKDNIGSLCLFIKKRPELFNELNNFINLNITLSQKIWCYLNNNKNIYCDCGKIKKWKTFKEGWRITCGDKECIVMSRKNTNLLTYGVDNPMKNENIKNKVTNTNIEKYGYATPAQNDNIRIKISKKLKNRSINDKNKTKIKLKNSWNKKTNNELEIIKNKRKKTNLNKTEIEKKEIIDKRKKTCLEKYGNEYAIVSSSVRTKILKIFNEKYGGNTPYADKNLRYRSAKKYKDKHIEYIKNNIKNYQCEYVSHVNKDMYGCNIEYTLRCLRKKEIFNIGYSSLRIRILNNLEISPFFREEHGTSSMEKELYEFIKNNYNSDILVNRKDIIKPHELDIYLPNLKLSFEFNGLYWHNELNKNKNYHLNKTEECEKQGIKLIHIYEDEWSFKQDIVKSRILNLLGKSNKIFARKCEIKEINDNKLIREFLENNHLQGNINSKIKIGLFYQDELVSIMTFGNLRTPLGQKSLKNHYEMLRFCNKLNINVVGGASKLFKYFINKYDPKEVISYADRSWSSGNLYEKLGFDLIHRTEPNYYYIIDGIRKHRYNYRKDKLVREGADPNKSEHEMMLNKKIYRIYDSGNLKYVYE
jgi:very-short-patch-repair endonuclease